MLQDFEGSIKPKEVNLKWCPFLVQVHGLPLGLMTETIGTILGETIGDVEEINAKGGNGFWTIFAGESFD